MFVYLLLSFWLSYFAFPEKDRSKDLPNSFHHMDKKITITVHSKVFELQLENNSTAEEWKERLPIRVKMKELNNN